MNKTIWNTNLFFQIIEFLLIFIFWIFFPTDLKAVAFAPFGVFFFHQIVYAIHCSGGSQQLYEPILDKHLWFLYVLVPFVAFHDTFESAHEKKPKLFPYIFQKFVTYEDKKINKTHVKTDYIEVKKDKGGWVIGLKDLDDQLVVTFSDDTSESNDQLLIALKIALNKKMIK
jgi:hypothetical protein